MEDIHNELNVNFKNNYYKTLNIQNYNNKKEREKIFYKYFKEREDSIISNIFYIHVINLFKCKCSKEIFSFQYYY